MEALERAKIHLPKIKHRDSLAPSALFITGGTMAKKEKKFAHPDSWREPWDSAHLPILRRERIEKEREEALCELRKEFRTIVNRCMCPQRSLEGRCAPSKCYSKLYKKLYPKGGYYQRKAVGDQLFLRAKISIGEIKKTKRRLDNGIAQKGSTQA